VQLFAREQESHEEGCDGGASIRVRGCVCNFFASE